MRRILLAGLLGGVAMFFWTSLAHMVLPLGEAGVGQIPNDSDLMNALHAKLGEAHGLYLFPNMGVDANATSGQKSAAMAAYGQKLATNPSGMLVYHPPGQQQLTPAQLITEFVTELAEAILLAWLLAQTVLKSYVSRVGFAVICGVVAAIVTNVSYWNWYGFPTSYTVSYMITEIIGFLVAGLVAARLIKGKLVAQ